MISPLFTSRSFTPIMAIALLITFAGTPNIHAEDTPKTSGTNDSAPEIDKQESKKIKSTDSEALAKPAATENKASSSNEADATSQPAEADSDAADVKNKPAQSSPTNSENAATAEETSGPETSEKTESGSQVDAVNANVQDMASQNRGEGTNDKSVPMKDSSAANSSQSISQKNTEIKKAPAASDIAANEELKKEENKRHMFIVSYNMAYPMGKSADFVKKFSVEGFGFGYRFMLKKQLSVGLSFNWNTFEKKEAGLLHLDKNTSINGTRIKMADLIQLTPTVQYHFFRQSAMAVPFVGLGLGPYYTSQIIDWGWWYQREATWQFGFSPEIGLRVARLPIPIYLSASYTYTFKANNIDAQQMLGIRVGVAFLK